MKYDIVVNDQKFDVVVMSDCCMYECDIGPCIERCVASCLTIEAANAALRLLSL
jgi:hypothetical protein